MISVDEEWSKYISAQSSQNRMGMFMQSIPKQGSQSVNTEDTCTHTPKIIDDKKTKNMNKKKEYYEELDDEFLEENDDSENERDDVVLCKPVSVNSLTKEVPKCDELYISTKTKVVFLNQEIDIHNVFWNIPIIEYWKPHEGVVKKQMKIVSKTQEEFENYKKKLEDVYYYTENIIKQIDNPSARRIKFKDERKITIGISKKDIMNCRGKVKNAFYNCFAMILRFKYEDLFREIHVKVFNTGKMEIPGILNISLLDIVKEMVLKIIQPHVNTPLGFIENNVDDNVLINSNFNCGFYINREKLHNILNKKYGIETSYDPCSYPGVKCKYYFNNDFDFDKNVQHGKITQEDRAMKMSELGDNKKYTEVSFMIFRTGSCLIVGNCSEKILLFIFEFIKKILMDEYPNIAVSNEEIVTKVKKNKLRKKTISVTHGYMQTVKSK